ncbi:uncharacterized protein [Spinacia oleracea]|uniref:RNase H type-1 domain-containing protein n=1 Tax=Spinacia oleracea TaxID=3562 RepID=A0ABM3RLG2_SPIOL|nr:uncharacterized protein LOC130470387 [Spinacia oleracea]
MENKVVEPANTVSYAVKVSLEVREELERARSRHNSAVTSLPTTWSKPDVGWTKVNVDAGVLGDTGTGIGMVMRDSEGVIVACSSWQGTEKWETRVAEAKAVAMGLQLAQEMGVRDVEMESDCLMVIQPLRGGSQGNNSFSLVIDDILDLCSSFDNDNVKWSFVKRSGNWVAHNLAHFQPWNFGQRVWVNDVPNDVLNVGFSDLLI